MLNILSAILIVLIKGKNSSYTQIVRIFIFIIIYLFISTYWLVTWISIRFQETLLPLTRTRTFFY